jgi:hypothetical protein
MRALRGVAVAAALFLSGCVDLDVTNPNEPDRDRVTSNPRDVQALISTSYQAYFMHAQETNPGMTLGAMSDNLTGGFFDFGVADMTTLPREPYNPNPTNTRGFIGRVAWSRLYPVISNVNDGLRAIDHGLRITTGPNGADETARAQAFARFVQGISYGYLALHHDQALIVTEDTDLETMDPTDFRPYQEVRDTALAMLDEAIAIAQANSFTIPGSTDWINGVTLSSADFIRVVNSYAARLIAYTPRGWDERAAVDWNEVIRRIDAGITTDFGPDGQFQVWESNTRRLLARVRTRPSDHVRPSYMALGPADVSGRFQTWFATAPKERRPFRITTPDARVHVPNGTAEGTYFGYNGYSLWPEERGTYRWSYYYYHRDGLGDSWYTGQQVTISRTEMDLLKAEALIRLGRADEAVPLINRTRVGNGKQPPVTLEGPPAGASCVPKKVTGECGSLWDALMHERNLENMAIESPVMWWDFRGLNRIPEGTVVHFPVSGIELENLGLPLYTFGGVGGQGAAPAPQYHRCPVALPRCEA